MYGCLNPDIVTDYEHQHRYKVEYAPIEKIPSILPSIQVFNKKYKALSNDVSSYKSFEFENLDLNLSRILILNRESNLKSYSVSIINTQSQEPEYYFDNLHIVETTGENLVFIFRWIPQDHNIPFDLSNYTGRLKKFDVHYNLIAEHSYANGLIQNSISGNSKYALLCYPYMECSCSGDPYYCGCTSSSCPVLVNANCSLTYVGGGGGGYEVPPGDGGGGGSGSGGTGDGNDGAIGDDGDPLYPIIPLEPFEDEDKRTPCEILKRQSIDNVEFGVELDSLRQRVLTTNPSRDTTETAINVERVGGQYKYTASTATGSGNGIVTVQGKVTNLDVTCMHNHPENTLPIFSYKDIITHYESYSFVSNFRKNEYTSYLVCYNNSTYALRIENTAALNNFFTRYDLNTAQGKMDAENAVLKIFEDYDLNTNQTYTQSMAEELFMKVICDARMGGGSSVNLYRKDSDGWGKLVKNGNVIEKEPCVF